MTTGEVSEIRDGMRIAGTCRSRLRGVVLRCDISDRSAGPLP